MAIENTSLLLTQTETLEEWKDRVTQLLTTALEHLNFRQVKTLFSDPKIIVVAYSYEVNISSDGPIEPYALMRVEIVATPGKTRCEYIIPETTLTCERSTFRMCEQGYAKIFCDCNDLTEWLKVERFRNQPIDKIGFDTATKSEPGDNDVTDSEQYKGGPVGQVNDENRS